MRQRNLYAEPYKIKAIEPIRLTTYEERQQIIKDAHYNLFNVKADDVCIDLLTDSGTGAMSANQWAGMMIGDESYAGGKSYYNLEAAIRDILGYEYLTITHQGRAAENILMSIFVKPGDVIPGNMHFDTTLGHINLKNGIPINLVCSEGLDTSCQSPFKGNMDLDRLEETIKEHGPEKIPFILMTVTCNSNGGQPVSMENIRGAAKIAGHYGIPLLFDAARFAENCYFIKSREPGYADMTIKEIAREMFALGEGATMSSKKDALVNMGGFLAFKNNEQWHDKATQLQICYEGYKTYGGLSGRDIEALARGLYEGIEQHYLEDRIGQVAYLGNSLVEAGVPIQNPPGGHGIYVDVRKMLGHIPQHQFPGQTLAIELYEVSGVRGCEIGSSALGYRDKESGEYVWPEMEFVRLAVPRRVYTDRHMNMVVEAFRTISEYKDKLEGMKRVYEAPVMAHFTAKFEKL
jgi:tryptophanase